jgi:phosphate transport system substrate-binding protein
MKHLQGLTLAACCLLFSGAQASELSIVGTGDGIEILAALGAAYTADNPETLVIVPPSIGSGGGIAAVGAEQEILGRIARPLKDTEKELGIVETPIFRLPSAIYVHPAAGIDELSTEDLKRIYDGSIRNWSALGGNDLGVKVVRREDIDSTLVVLRETMPGWNNLNLTERSKTAYTTQESVQTVVNTPGAIGFGPYTKPLEHAAVVLKIDGKYPTDDGYPSAVTVSFIHKDRTATEEAKQVITFAQSEKARTLIIGMGGVPVSR